MAKKVQIMLATALLLLLAMAGLQGSAARGFEEGIPTTLDAEALAAVSRVKLDLTRRLNVDPNRIMVQRIEDTVFPDASLGRPEPNRVYPLVPTPGYNIRLTIDGVVYRYWATDKRIVYLESFPEPSAVPESRGWLGLADLLGRR